MEKKPEGGAMGTAQRKAYTYRLIQGMWIAFAIFSVFDLSQNGSGYLCTALGMESRLWIGAFFLFAMVLPSAFAASVVSATYFQHTGIVYTEDRIGFAKSGGSDIAFWSGFFAFIGTLFAFTKFVPNGYFGWFRPFILLIIAIIMGCIAARILARWIFSALFGPPKYRPFD